MISIALAVFSLFIIYVMVWSIRNDGVRSIKDQTGWIKMRNPEAMAQRSDNGTNNGPGGADDARAAGTAPPPSRQRRAAPGGRRRQH